jgi:CelD/BcsL family acetyltransferase involved in cellulose biosynthesis
LRQSKHQESLLDVEYMQVKVIDSLASMADLSKEWNDLLRNSHANSVFLTWEWTYAWAESFLDESRRLFVLALYEGQELVGLAPWYAWHTRLHGCPVIRIEFLGSPETGSDYLDVVCRKRREKDVAQKVCEFLFRQSRDLWDIVSLRDVPSESLFLLYCLEVLERKRTAFEIHSGSFCPIFLLPDNRDDFLSKLTKHRRQQYLSDGRQLQKQGDVVHHRLSGEQNLAALSDFHALYNQRWKKSEQDLRFLEKLFTLSVKTGLCETNFLTINGKNYAAGLQLYHDQIVYLYHLVADRSFGNKISVGNYLVGRCIERALAEGFRCYDFLRGSEEYKFYWANGGRRSLHLEFFNRRLIPALDIAIRGIKASVKVLRAQCP